VSSSAKSEQLQIRVTARQKAQLQKLAAAAGLGMSAYVLERALPGPSRELHDCLSQCTHGEPLRFALADLNRLLSKWSRVELKDALAVPGPGIRNAVAANHAAAQIEQACATRGVTVPDWVRAIEPLDEPVFGSPLQSLRLYLLSHSPPPFRRRNLFVDSALGAQV
jgi:uncharacterized protein (DUF1778 family)